MTDYPVVRVTWTDAWSDSRKYTVEELRDAPEYIHVVVGHLILNDPDKLAIATTLLPLHPHAEFQDVHVIPRTLVRKVEILEVVEAVDATEEANEEDS